MPLKWNADQYVKFIKERTEPAADLANKIPLKNPHSVIDIGCGPGNSTKVLANKFPYAQITGADNSYHMLDKAKIKYPNINFIFFDAIKSFAELPQKYDVVFSNACIQWVADHRTLLPNMMKALNDGGILAVQIPINFKEPIHVIIETITQSAKWKSRFAKPRIMHILTSEEYFDLLSKISSDFSIWETTYFHRLPSHKSIIEWYKGTGLRPYLASLNQNDAFEFEKDVYHEIIKAYPKQDNGEIIFKFPRLFFTAVK